jgi:murein DD-endopeptidase MepM/ murein hydrolase activator NlpD
MFDSDIDNFLSQIVGDVKGLFDSKQSFNTPPGQTTPKPGGNVIPSAGGFTAPIHGNWASSGGFDLTSKRPNGRIGHQGVDMRCPIGTPIYPLSDGVVTNVGTDPLGGNVVNVQHGNGVRTYYAHMSTVKVQKGDKVTTNTVLGSVGMTGNAKGTVPHLHFQVWQDGQIQDPAKYFSAPPYTQLSAEEKQQGIWLSPQAKQEAEAFNMQDHLANRRTAFSKDVDKLMKLAHDYYKLAR